MKLLRTILLVLCCILFFSVAACAETPSTDIVTNKGENTLENKITSSDGTGIDISSDNLIDEFTNSAGNVTFKINADITSPDVSTFPVLKAVPHFFTSEELERISNIICNNNPIYEYSEVLTKSELESEILIAKQYINNKDYLMEYYNNNEDLVANIIDIYEQRIHNMETEYQSAPEDSVKELAAFKFYDDSHYVTASSIVTSLDGVRSFKATSTVNNIPMFIWAAQRNDNEYTLSNICAYPYSFRNPDLQSYNYYQTTIFNETDLSKAINIVENTLIDMELDNWKIYSYGIGNYSATFKCTPEYCGIQMSPDQNWASLSNSLEYLPSYTYPNLEITISNNQIIDFRIEGSLDILETLSKNVSLLTYEDIIQRIYDQLEISWTSDRMANWVLPDTAIDPVQSTIEITNIELTLVRTNVKNDTDSYYILPAWIVYGSTTINEYKINDTLITRPLSYISSSSIPLLVINAIDGSVIDMSQGY